MVHGARETLCKTHLMQPLANYFFRTHLCRKEYPVEVLVFVLGVHVSVAQAQSCRILHLRNYRHDEQGQSE